MVSLCHRIRVKEWDSHSRRFHPHRMSGHHWLRRGHLQGVCCMLFLNKLTPQQKKEKKKGDCFLFCDYGFVQYCRSYWRKEINLGVNNNKVRSSRSIWNEFHILCKQFLLATPKQHEYPTSSEYVVCTLGNCWNLVSICIYFNHRVWHRLCAVSWCLFGVLSLAQAV